MAAARAWLSSFNRFEGVKVKLGGKIKIAPEFEGAIIQISSFLIE
jgi:hypothetical protein